VTTTLEREEPRIEMRNQQRSSRAGGVIFSSALALFISRQERVSVAELTGAEEQVGERNRDRGPQLRFS
jgi:hypothetical protein